MGLPYWVVAEKCGVSKGIVGQVRNGTRDGPTIRRAEAQEYNPERVPIVRGGKVSICRHCGHAVEQPCVDCLYRIQREYDRTKGAA